MRTTETLESIRKRLLAVLDNRPDMIVPVLAKRILLASGWVLPGMSVNAIEELIVDMESLEEVAAEYGRTDIADELEEISQELSFKLPPPEVDSSCKIGINFRSGHINGDCSGCDAAKVSEALTAVAEALRDCDETPRYAGFSDDQPYTQG